MCFIGADGVGKTSIILRYTRNSFSTSYLATIGCEFYEIAFNHYSEHFQVYLWDIASQKNFETMRSHYLYNAHLVVICCDNKRFSDEYINPWILEAKKNISPQMKYILVMNKTDLETNVTLLNNIKSQLEQNYNVPVVLTSAKTGENVNLLFQTIETFLFNEYINKKHDSIQTDKI